MKFDEILKDDINFLLEKITPDWILFGTGVIEFQKIFSLKMDRKSKITRSEIEIKKEISKSIIELLSNLSLNYPNCYRLFWATYSNSLKANLLQKRYMIKNFLYIILGVFQIQLYQAQLPGLLILSNTYVRSAER